MTQVLSKGAQNGQVLYREFRVCRSVLRVLGVRVSCSGVMIEVLGCRVHGSWFRAYGLGVRVLEPEYLSVPLQDELGSADVWFRVWGCGFGA